MSLCALVVDEQFIIQVRAARPHAPRAIVVNITSSSLSAPAFTNTICCPMACAAASTSFIAESSRGVSRIDQDGDHACLADQLAKQFRTAWAKKSPRAMEKPRGVGARPGKAMSYKAKFNLMARR